MPALTDGYQTLISFAADTDVLLYEKQVTPPGVDGGDPIDQTTMRNSDWRTAAPRSLKMLTNGSMTVAYDPATYDEVMALINTNTLITVTLPNGGTWAFYGYLKSFVPSELTEGEQPEAECEIIPTLRNGSGVETAPVYTAP